MTEAGKFAGGSVFSLVKRRAILIMGQTKAPLSTNVVHHYSVYDITGGLCQEMFQNLTLFSVVIGDN